MKFFLLPICLIIALSSCKSRIERFGYLIEDAQYSHLQEGVSTKNRVLAIMGSPTLVTDLTVQESWIYYSEKTDRFLFFKPKIIQREIVVMKFEDDIMAKIEKIDLAMANQKLQFSQDHTPVKSHKTGFFKAIFGNVGQVSAQ